VCIWSTSILPWQSSMPCFESHGFLPNLVHLHVYYIVTSCSLNLHDLVTYPVKILLVGLVCGSFQFIPQSSVILPSFFVVDILPLHSSNLLITSCVIHGLHKHIYKIVINTFIVLHVLYCKECKQYANRLANNDKDYKVHDSCRGAWGSKSQWQS